LGFRAKSPIFLGIFVVSLLVLVSLVSQAEAGYGDCFFCNQVWSVPGGGQVFFNEFGNIESTYWSSSFPTPGPYTPSSDPSIPQLPPGPPQTIRCEPSLLGIDDLYSDATDSNYQSIITWEEHHLLFGSEVNPNAIEECLVSFHGGPVQWFDYSEELFSTELNARNEFDIRVQEYQKANEWSEVTQVNPIALYSVLFTIKSTQPTSGTLADGKTLIFQSGPYLISLHSWWAKTAWNGVPLDNWGEIYDEDFLREAAKSIKEIIVSSDNLVISKGGLTADITIPKCNDSIISLDEFRSIAGDDSYSAKSGDYLELSKKSQYG